MRRVIRATLNKNVLEWLGKRQAKIDDESNNGKLVAVEAWNATRNNRNIHAIRSALKDMVGKRERCMYCLDSHGTDIEHFWPKSHFPGRMYEWPNMLLCCTDCGRIKSDQFPLDLGELPLLIDPSSEDPWKFLEFDPVTGNVTARFDLSMNDFCLKGVETVRVLQLDRREALAEGYCRTWKRLKKLVQDFLQQGEPQDLHQALLEEDEHGLLGWCFKGSGQQESPFIELKDKHSAVWQRCLDALQ